MKSQLLQRVKSCPNLPSMPAIAVEVLELTKDDTVDISQIAGLVSRDPAMAAKILKTANSSFYGCSQRVATMSQALMILGLNSVKTLVLGFSLVNNLSRGQAKGFDHRAYWKRSIYAATAARALAPRAGVAELEEAFLAALLADVGVLVLDLTVGEAYGATTVRAASHEDLPAVEAADLGGTHAEVGGLIAEKWRLPALLAGPIAHHHDRDLSDIADPVVRRLTAAVHLAGRVADVFVDADAGPALVDVRRIMALTCNLTEPAAVDALMAEIGRQSGEAAGLFELNVATEPDYETILERADEAMVELTLKSQQQATQLAVQNVQLQRAATTDGLTGLANRAQFDQVLAERLAAANRSGTRCCGRSRRW
jgi:two-component system cell cycle response regulator